MKAINMSRRSFLGAAGIAAAGLGLTACGGGSNGGGASAGGASGTEGGGTITAASAYAPSTFDPTKTGSAIGLCANWHVLEGLYGTDFHDYSIHKELANEDEPTKIDDNTFEVTIRDGATYSDGTEVKAADIVNSYNLCVSGGVYTAFFEPFESLEAKDDKTVTIKTKVANFGLLKERLAIIRAYPASQTADEVAAKPIGSGPWMYDSMTDKALDLVPNPNYNGEFKPKDEKLHFDVVTDGTARLTEQQEGTSQVMELVTADAIDTLEGAGCKIDNVQGFGTRFIMFNVAKEQWNNVKLRQAVMYAINYDQIVSNTFAGLATPASCYLPETFTNYHEAATVYTTDADKAKSLLEESGATAGPIVMRTTDNEQVKGMATQIKEDLDALGFTVEIKTDTSPATYSAIDSGTDGWDILVAPGDPSCFGGDTDLLLSWWYGDGVWMKQRCPWGTSAEWKQVNELMTKALGQTGDEQQSTWNEVFDLIAENCVLYPLVHVKTVTASWDDPSKSPSGTAIKNFEGIGTTGMMFLEAASLKA